jgi:hypothetical protein
MAHMRALISCFWVALCTVLWLKFCKDALWLPGGHMLICVFRFVSRVTIEGAAQDRMGASFITITGFT